MLSSWYVIPMAFILDYIIGDPQNFPHPVRLMGKCIEVFEERFRGFSKNQVLAGFYFAIVLISLTGYLTWVFLGVMGQVSPFLRVLFEVVLLYYCISARCLEKAAMDVKGYLDKGDLFGARSSVSMIVGRETSRLDEAGVTRAAVETVAENLVDGFVSPLFFAMIGGVPMAMAFKMVNTLDSMVGYKNDRYLEFGKASARIDDLFNFIPARISVVIISAASFILSGCGKAAFKTGILDGRKHASPNAGFSEAAFAGALGVRLGGPNYYHGQCVEKPYIGDGLADAVPGDIGRACDLMMLSAALWMVLVWAFSTLF